MAGRLPPRPQGGERGSRQGHSDARPRGDRGGRDRGSVRPGREPRTSGPGGTVRCKVRHGPVQRFHGKRRRRPPAARPARPQPPQRRRRSRHRRARRCRREQERSGHLRGGLRGPDRLLRSGGSGSLGRRDLCRLRGRTAPACVGRHIRPADSAGHGLDAVPGRRRHEHELGQDVSVEPGPQAHP